MSVQNDIQWVWVTGTLKVFPGSYAEFLKMIEENAVPDESKEIEDVTKTGVKETFFAFDENNGGKKLLSYPARFATSVFL